MRILFVGNSFTYFNDMPEMLGDIARLNGDDLEVESVTKGGRSLLQHLEADDECSEKLRKAFFDRPDAVVLQEQSHTPISSADSFVGATRALVKKIRDVGATPYLYATWGYKKGHPKLELYGKDTADMEKKLREAYTAVGKELDVGVCHVGAAMTYAYTKSDIELYQADCYHPSVQGSLIAALTVYSTVFSTDPSNLLIPDGIVSPADERIIKQSVYNALVKAAK